MTFCIFYCVLTLKPYFLNTLILFNTTVIWSVMIYCLFFVFLFTCYKCSGLKAEEFEQDESESSKDTVMSYWPFIAGGATIIIFLLVVMVCCIMYKQNSKYITSVLNKLQICNVCMLNKVTLLYFLLSETSDQQYYANSQQGKPFTYFHSIRPRTAMLHVTIFSHRVS